jgi:type IV pilus assembly protein PilA
VRHVMRLLSMIVSRWLPLRCSWHRPVAAVCARPALGRRRAARGYTLVELMIVVAIVGVLAALAVYGVRQYMSAARSAEAKDMVGAIAKAAVAAFSRTETSANVVAVGGDAGTSEHQLCNGLASDWVPADPASVKGLKYQPSAQATKDFHTGSTTSGWKCLRFGVTNPMIYRLNYCRGCGDYSGALAGDFFVARAEGDTDADDVVAHFMLGGVATADAVNMQTRLWIENESD